MASFVAAQRRAIPPLFLGAGALCLLAPPPPSAQSALLLIGVAAGMPHGALDARTGRALFGPGGWPAFLGLYLLLAGSVLLLWRVAPGLGLASFLLLAAVHFGEGEDRGEGEGEGWAERFAVGALPIVVPAVARPHEMAAIFAELAGGAGVRLLGLIDGPVALLWLAAAALAVGRMSAGRPAEAAATAALFAAAPPLVAFALYFGLLHAPRALVREAGGEVGRALRDAAPWTAAALAGGALLWAAEGADTSVMRAVFQLLAALTAPHMALAALAKRSGRSGVVPFATARLTRATDGRTRMTTTTTADQNQGRTAGANAQFNQIRDKAVNFAKAKPAATAALAGVLGLALINTLRGR